MLRKSLLVGVIITTVVALANIAGGEKTFPGHKKVRDSLDAYDDGGLSGHTTHDEDHEVSSYFRADKGGDEVANCKAGKCTLPVLANSKHPPTGMVLIISAYYLLISDFRFWLDNVCKRNKKLPKAKQMRDLVLWDVAVQTTDPNGCDTGPDYTLLTYALDVVAPWFPGGSESCFDRLWVGTVELAAETDWVTNPTFVANSIDWSVKIGTEFKARYPNTTFNWFITHNTNIDDLRNSAVADAYKGYISKLINELRKIEKGNVMWSPKYSSAYADFSSSHLTAFETNVKDFFTTVKSDAPPGITWLNIRDNSDAQHCPACTAFNRNETTDDTIKRYKAMKKLFNGKKITVSEILGVVAENCVLRNAQLLIPDQIEIEEKYMQEGVPLGPGYELQFWRMRDQNCNILSEGN